MILTLELTGAFVAGGAASLVAFAWLARRKIRQMLRPKLVTRVKEYADAAS